MSDHKLTFDEATDKLFAWIKANFKWYENINYDKINRSFKRNK
jgi:hypothetical protein